jgi:hypothetical protein
MQVKQLSIFMENRAGRLQEITGVLGNSGINIRAISLADTSDFGILRLIVNKPEEAAEILRNEGFIIRENNVIACVIDDQPGGLYKVVKILGDAKISIEYMYGFFEKKTEKAVMIIRVEDPEKAIALLQKSFIPLLRGEEVYSI